MRPTLCCFVIGLWLSAIGCDGQSPAASLTSSWSQYQGGTGHSGAKLIRTEAAMEDSLKWEVDVGPVSGSSPVVGPDGTIYVGNANGELVAVWPYGVERWRRAFHDGGTILSTPAVGENGEIYVAATWYSNDELLSTVEAVRPSGQRHWSRTLSPNGGVTTVSPTVHDHHVYALFVSETGVPELLVIDEIGNTVVQTRTDDPGSNLCGANELVSDLWEFASCPWLAGCSFEGPGNSTVPTLPTVSVVESPELTPGRGPIAVVADNRWMTAYELRGTDLQLLWRKVIFGGGCDDGLVAHSTPVITANGAVVASNELGEVRGFDVLTGDELWEENIGEPSTTAPASFGRQIYVVTENRLHQLDYNGQPIKSRILPAPSLAPPVISANHVYVATEFGLMTFTLDLDGDQILDAGAVGNRQTPAVGDDGTLYFVTEDGRLRAYGGDPIPPVFTTPPGPPVTAPGEGEPGLPGGSLPGIFGTLTTAGALQELAGPGQSAGGGGANVD